MCIQSYTMRLGFFSNNDMISILYSKKIFRKQSSDVPNMRMVMCPLEKKGRYLRFTAVTIILFLKIIYYPKIPFKTRNKIKDY